MSPPAPGATRAAGPTGGSPGTPLVAVVGGGIAGLAAARALAAAGARVVVLESGPTLGGKIRSATVGGVPVDVGPDAFVARRPEAVELCRAVGLADDLVAPGAAGAAIWARGRLRPLPAGIVLGVPTRLLPLARSGILSPAGTARASLDLLARSPAPRPGGTGTDGGPAHGGTGDDSVAAVVERHLGRQVARRLADPLVGGINAGPTTAMSAAAVFPALLQADRAGGSLMRRLRPPRDARDQGAGPVLLTVRGGLGRVVERLASALTAGGVVIRTSSAVERVVPRCDRGRWAWQVDVPGGPVTAQGVVLAVPAPVAARLLRPAPGTGAGAAGPEDSSEGGGSTTNLVPGGSGSGTTTNLVPGGGSSVPGGPERAQAVAHALERLATSLAAVEHASVSAVTYAFDASGPAARWLHAPGTGYLVPTEQGLLATGVTWLSTKWPHLAAEGRVLVRVSAGRYGDDRAGHLDDGALARRLLAELRATAGDVDDPVDTLVTRWAGAFPQYRVGHQEWLARVTALTAAIPALGVAGASFEGVGIPACIGSGERAAGRVADGLGLGDR